jgi:RimJ/RimL family protein N-acetyltransferase
VREETALRRLVAITSDDNTPSQRIALKCGFTHTGPPREDPVHGMCFEWAADPVGSAAGTAERS